MAEYNQIISDGVQSDYTIMCRVGNPQRELNVKKTLCELFSTCTYLSQSAVMITINYVVHLKSKEPCHKALTQWLDSSGYFYKMLLDVGPQFITDNPEIKGQTNRAHSLFGLFLQAARVPYYVKLALSQMFREAPTQSLDKFSMDDIWLQFVRAHSEHMRTYFRFISDDFNQQEMDDSHVHPLTYVGVWICKHRSQW